MIVGVFHSLDTVCPLEEQVVLLWAIKGIYTLIDINKLRLTICIADQIISRILVAPTGIEPVFHA